MTEHFLCAMILLLSPRNNQILTSMSPILQTGKQRQQVLKCQKLPQLASDEIRLVRDTWA